MTRTVSISPRYKTKAVQNILKSFSGTILRTKSYSFPFLWQKDSFHEASDSYRLIYQKKEIKRSFQTVFLHLLIKGRTAHSQCFRCTADIVTVFLQYSANTLFLINAVQDAFSFQASDFTGCSFKSQIPLTQQRRFRK